MKFTIRVLIESPDALPLSVPIQTIERLCDQIEDVGLRLEKAKAILGGLQEHRYVSNSPTISTERVNGSEVRRESRRRYPKWREATTMIVGPPDGK
jgi:hypothetical protein